MLWLFFSVASAVSVLGGRPVRSADTSSASSPGAELSDCRVWMRSATDSKLVAGAAGAKAANSPTNWSVRRLDVSGGSKPGALNVNASEKRLGNRRSASAARWPPSEWPVTVTWSPGLRTPRPVPEWLASSQR